MRVNKLVDEKKDISLIDRLLERKIALSGFGAAALFWLIDGVVDAYVFGRGTVFEQIFRPVPYEVYFRSVVALVIIMYGLYAQSMQIQRRRLESALENARKDIIPRPVKGIASSNWVVIGGIGLAVFVWFLDVFVCAYFSREGTVFEQIFNPGLSEVYLRSIVAFLIIIFSFFVRRLIYRQEIMELALKRAYDELKTLDDLKTNIISNVTHELRTPITIAKGSLEMLTEVDDPKTEKMLIKKALDAIARQNMIVEDLVTASKLSEMVPGSDLVLEDVDIEGLIKLMVAEFEVMASEKGIKLNVDLAKSLPAVKADYKKLKHLLKNIMNNAIKFTDEGSVSVKARDKGDTIEICVADTGIGMAEEHRDAIFENLYQIDPSSTRRYGGTGMGLAIAKHIIEAHGGKIWAESELGKGSSFFVRLAKS